MRKIFKYPLGFMADGKCRVVMPADATMMDVQFQKLPAVESGPQPYGLMLWVAVQTDVLIERTFVMVPTGGEIPDDTDEVELFYVKTIQTNGGALVHHIFVEVPRAELAQVIPFPKPSKPPGTPKPSAN